MDLSFYSTTHTNFKGKKKNVIDKKIRNSLVEDLNSLGQDRF